MILWPLISLMLTVPAEVLLCTYVCHTQPHALVACLIDSPYVPLMNGNFCSADEAALSCASYMEPIWLQHIQRQLRSSCHPGMCKAKAIVQVAARQVILTLQKSCKPRAPAIRWLDAAPPDAKAPSKFDTACNNTTVCILLQVNRIMSNQ